MQCIILSVGGGQIALLEEMGLCVESHFEVREFFTLETYQAVKMAQDKGIALIGINMPLVDMEGIEFKDFIRKCKESYAEKRTNLYYYPKPNVYYQADSIMLFMVFKDFVLEKFLIEILYRQQKLPLEVRNKTHTYLNDILFGGVHKRIHLEGRPLSNLSTSWELFESKELSIQLCENAVRFYPAPLHISLGTINRCNLKCNFCHFFSPSHKKTHTTDFFDTYKELDDKIVRDVFDYAAKYGSKIDLVGPCEMLLDKRVPDFIAYGKSVGVKYISMTTNGLLLDEVMAHKILNSGLNSLSISIDAATEETYKENRGGNFKKLIKNVEYFLGELEKTPDKMLISLSMILNKNAEEEVEKFKSKWSAYRCVNELYIRNLVCKKNDGLDVSHEKNITFKNRFVCQKIWSDIHINPDGSIVPCCTMSGAIGWHNKNLGNLYKQSLEEIWTGAVACGLRRDLINEDFSNWKICANCQEWSYVPIEQENGNIVSPIIEFVKVR